MSRRDLEARAASVSQRGPNAEGEETDSAGRALRRSTTPRIKPVQLTVTIENEMYRFLKDYPATEDLYDITGRARIPTVEVLRAVIEEMIHDAGLRRKVAKRVIRNLI